MYSIRTLQPSIRILSKTIATPPTSPCNSFLPLISTRYFSHSVPLSKGPSHSSPPQKGSKILRDEDIPHKLVVLVDPTTKSLLPPSTLSSLLSALDRTRYSIQLVDPSNDPPICRILDKKEAYQKAKDKKVKDAERAATQVANAGGEVKEVHLTWGGQ